MIALAALLAQAAPITAPVMPEPARAASPRTLTGRFACDAAVYDIALTSTTGQSVRLDRLAIGGKSVDAGSLAEAGRRVALLTDVQSLDVRCRGDAGELSVYGFQRQAGVPRRARLRGTLRGGRVEGISLAVEQRSIP